MGGGPGVHTRNSLSLTNVSIGAKGCMIVVTHIFKFIEHTPTYSNLQNVLLIRFCTPVGKEVRWSSMQGHMLQLSGLEGGGRCGSGSLGAGGILSPGSSPPGSGLLPAQLFFDDSQ